MGRTIPSFRIATVLEEEKWKLYRKYLKNKNKKKLFIHMFSIANLYNSACSNAINPIRIHPIMMSIILHHYKMLKERTSSFCGIRHLSFLFYYYKKHVYGPRYNTGSEECELILTRFCSSNINNMQFYNIRMIL